MLRARLSISEVHFLMMKGTPSGLFLAAWAKSMPNRCRRPWSFLWPHWMASVSRHFLWQASEHWASQGRKKRISVSLYIRSWVVRRLSIPMHHSTEQKYVDFSSLNIVHVMSIPVYMFFCGEKVCFLSCGGSWMNVMIAAVYMFVYVFLWICGKRVYLSSVAYVGREFICYLCATQCGYTVSCLFKCMLPWNQLDCVKTIIPFGTLKNLKEEAHARRLSIPIRLGTLFDLEC